MGGASRRPRVAGYLDTLGHMQLALTQLARWVIPILIGLAAPMVLVSLWHPIFSTVFVPIVRAVADAFGTTAAQIGHSVAVALDIVGGLLLGAVIGAVLALAYRTVRAPWLAFAACFVTTWLLAAASQDFLLGGLAQLISPLLLSFIVASGLVYIGALPRRARKHVP